MKYLDPPLSGFLSTILSYRFPTYCLKDSEAAWRDQLDLKLPMVILNITEIFQFVTKIWFVLIYFSQRAYISHWNQKILVSKQYFNHYQKHVSFHLWNLVSNFVYEIMDIGFFPFFYSKFIFKSFQIVVIMNLHREIRSNRTNKQYWTNIPLVKLYTNFTLMTPIRSTNKTITLIK